MQFLCCNAVKGFGFTASSLFISDIVAIYGSSRTPMSMS
jgi:hypothetical protein